jgi:hypothetical protein
MRVSLYKLNIIIMREVLFKKSWVALCICIAFYLIFISIVILAGLKLKEENNYEAIFVYAITIHILYFLVFWKGFSGYTYKFYEDGISFRGIFRRFYVKWDQVEDISVNETYNSFTLVYSSKSKRGKKEILPVSFLHYKNPQEIKDFVLQKLSNKS